MFNNLSLKKLSLIWLGFLLLAVVIVSASHFKSESNDSKYYTELVVRYHHSSFSEMIAPKWGENFWGFEPQTFMRDQFPGQLLLGVAFAKIGIPADQALHVLGMFFQVGSFLILGQLVLEFMSVEAALFVVSCLLITPLAFSYNLRANHELGIMFFCFLSLYSGYRYHQSKWWLIVLMVSASMLLLIKGPFFIFALTSFACGFLTSPKDFLKLFLPEIMGVLAVAITGLIFEKMFLSVTGESFFKEFWNIQISQRAMTQVQSHSFIVQKLINFWYYFSHYLTYSLPWSLLFIVMMVRKKKILHTQLSWQILMASMAFCLFFSMSDRVAGRYTIPGYFLFSGWIALMIYNLSPQLQDKIKSHKEKLVYGIPAFWFFSIVAHFIVKT